ncbi:cation:dicarboxylase symporter family transporter [Pedobacter sp. MC2016-14]|uniref:dicarboxylate/amino acid:cation symporter n=1 Tax=Pedobacter sp. MC2016-14 TaxID=2897327 RepID=UPI001E308F2C|nr:cation:dicarboxylase symporter family transporter [Pedobacter sp. MC2016-14]MCD0490651.1 cation:dicarboxylase symporter family transporter [Pedobacter sp. MC2016-14]
MTKNNRLTFFIFLALVLGVGFGYYLNVKSFDSYNQAIVNADQEIAKVDAALLKVKDTADVSYAPLNAAKKQALKTRVENEKLREKKLEPLTLLSDIFLRLIKMIVAPLVFTTLVVGVAKVGDIKAVGRIGGKTMLWFVSASLLSLVLGMIMVNIFRPGETMNLPLPPENIDTGLQKAAFSIKDFISHIFPKSMTEAMATNEILQIVVFSLFFGVATAAIGEKGKVVIEFFDAVAHVILKVTGYVMNFAPFAVFGAMAAIVAKQGLSVISTYALFIGEFYSTMLLLWIILIFIGFAILKGRVFNLVSRMKEPVLVAFSTASSEAAYPRTMLQLERFGCKDKIVSFVLPLGYSFNLDGSMLYMTFASLFIAQAYGIHLSFEQQITMLLILMLTSKGIAGVPRASLVVIAGTIATFNIPEAGLALLIGIDPLLDMGRSATNVIGNSLATAVVSKWEGELSPAQD